MDWVRGSLTISTDPARIDRQLVHEVLAGSYWAEAIPREVVDRSIDNSLVFGIYEGAAQLGFARVITDRSTFAYLSDVFVVESRRGQGLGRWLMEVIMGHPDLQGLRRWTLATRDAHGLYRQFGFKPLARPERFMEILDAEVYREPTGGSKVREND